MKANTKPVVLIENQVDFRTQRKSKDTKLAEANRQRRKGRKAAGLCTICGETPVQNRVNCKLCTDAGTKARHRWVFRLYNMPLPPELM